MSAVIKLSSPSTHHFWEIPVLHEDADLLVLNKPPLILTSPDRQDPNRPSLMALLHAGIEQDKAWARERQLTYLANAHRLDDETSGALLLAKNKPALVALANIFGSGQPVATWTVLIHGAPSQDRFTVDAKLSAHPLRAGEMRVDGRTGKRARTEFEVRERFSNITLLDCRPLTVRRHQVRVHLRHAGYPIIGDALYGGHALLLSHLKSGYRLKPGRTENPLLQRPAEHVEKLSLAHPTTKNVVEIIAPWPKDLTVALKYLRRYAANGSAA